VVKSFAMLWFVILFVGLPSVVAAQSSSFVDSMRPPHVSATASGKVKNGGNKAVKPLQLQAVLVSEERSVAVINGQLLQLGEWIGGYKVTRISAEAVILQGKSGQRTLKRTGRGVKKTVTKSAIKKGNKQ